MDLDIREAIGFIADMKQGKRNWFMPGDGRYQPKELKPFLGYDQWADWLAMVEWYWMLALARLGKMPARDAKLLTKERLFRMLNRITTTKQDKIEKETKHDIIALRHLMIGALPKRLHRWLHLGATSYDIISTAYALQAKSAFEEVVWPKIKDVDFLFLRRIDQNAKVLQAGRTHLQTALPVTVGFWLAGLRSRFVGCARLLYSLGQGLEGKFSGAVGTYASQNNLLEVNVDYAEQEVMGLLGLKKARVSTQITPPESMARFYSEMVLLSGVLANLGEDVRILQSSQFGEVISASSTSSAMPHKKSNPIAAENVSGMHVSVLAEFQKVLGTLVSDLQRDLRGSSVMRSQSAVMVYTYQQLLTAERILETLKVDASRCRENFEVASKLVVAELLHLALQIEGLPNSHELVNKVIVPEAAKTGMNLTETMVVFVPKNQDVGKYWDRVPCALKHILQYPERYIGSAVEMAWRELRDPL